MFKLAALFLIAAACVVHISVASAGEPHVQGAEPSAGRELAEKYAPIVYQREQRQACDTRGSPYFPAPVEFVLEQDGIVLRRHVDGLTTDVMTAPGATDLFGLDDSYFLDFPGSPRRPGCRYEQDFLARAREYRPTAYAHIAYEEGRDGFALQYWFFYYFNHWNNTHEGDWEMVQLTFDGPTPQDALSQDPIGVGYSQHGGGERSDWDDEKLAREGSRIIAYAAAGANASQFEPNIILGRGDNGTGFGCDDARMPARPYDLDVVLVEEPQGADSPYAWLAYDGRWGERAPWEFNGPTGPNDKLAWTQPFTWEERLRPSSIIVPSRDVLSINAVNLFCDAAWYLSTPLFAIAHLPLPVLFGGFALVAGGLMYATSRGTYRPILSEPLRRRRHFGQVLTSSARVYREHLPLFLLLGAIYVPVGFVMSFVQWLVFHIPFVDSVTGFFTDELLVRAMLGVAMGGLGSSLVYWFVISASVAAVARIERRRADEPLATFREVWQKLVDILLPRLKAVAIIALLGVSIVGIPWAVRNVFRWVFIEQAVLFDNVSRKEAAAASARAVDGSWWHAARSLLVLSTLVLLIGPAIAVSLMFWSPISVYAVNITASVIFAALTPYVGIAEALLYFDLKARKEEDPA